jgi:hypothetical protein
VNPVPMLNCIRRTPREGPLSDVSNLTPPS